MSFITPVPLPTSVPAKAPKLIAARRPELGEVMANFRYTHEDGSESFDISAKPVYPHHKTQWFEVKGSFDDALAGARAVARYEDDPWYAKNDVPARTSAAIVAAGTGTWMVGKVSMPDDEDMDMAAILSLPIEAVRQEDFDVALPFPRTWGTVSAEVEIVDPRIQAIVGAETWVDNRRG